MKTSRQAVADAAQRLRGEYAARDAELLLMHALGVTRASLLANPARELTTQEQEKFSAMVAERATGRPIQYITGVQEFYGLAFAVTPVKLYELTAVALASPPEPLRISANETPPAPPVAAMGMDESMVLRATASGVELNQGGQSMSLLHVRAAQRPGGQPDVTYSAGAQGSMRARYVDLDTGNVTINNVYVQ